MAEEGGAPGAPEQAQSDPVAEKRMSVESSCDGTQRGMWGLSLSGGGIRSATFCFGLLKALARNGVLGHFDLVSTVSGGGYVGGTLGKLCQEFGPDRAQEALADADKRWFAYWLRANGRYLIPHGARDALFAIANFLRNLVGIHLEIAMLGIVLGGVLVGIDLFVWWLAEGQNLAHGAVFRDFVGLASQWPTLWLLLIPEAFAAATLGGAYWSVPGGVFGRVDGFRWATAVVCLTIACGLGWHVLGSTSDPLNIPPGTASLVLLAIALGLLANFFATFVAVLVRPRVRLGEEEDNLSRGELTRDRLTRGLGVVLRWIAATAVLGLVDLLAWQFAQSSVRPWAAGAGVAFAVAVLRGLLPLVGDLPRGLPPLPRGLLMELLNLAGVAALMLLFTFWVSIVHRVTWQALFASNLSLDWVAGLAWLLTITVPPVLFMVASARNREFLNRSSLFSFYRARLVRSYLGATNRARFAGDATAPARPNGTAVVSVTDVVPGDDLHLKDYAPQAKGGPVHLVNVCVNQTLDPGRGLFNRDRKGVLMTVAPGGWMRVDQGDWESASDDELTLGAWTAISGAAVASGLGASTRPGLAGLLVLAGMRLGYWWDSGVLADRDKLPRLGKYGQLRAELRGAFEGVTRRDWYLSDGGHFENTGAYALLREECALIVLADCGADPRFAFGDLENLVRKARIDLQADITFLRPKQGDASVGPCMPAPPNAFGSLNDLASAESNTCLALAKVDYRSGKRGYIIVAKPNMCGDASVDLVNFKADNRLFPQESTTDQFFSEAQWESYYQLGQVVGGEIDLEFAKSVGSHASNCFGLDEGSVAKSVATPGREKASPKRVPSRIAATSALTASVGLGALFTMASNGWQVLDTQLQSLSRAHKVDAQVVKELSDAYADLPVASTAASAPTTAVTRLAAKLARVNEEECNPANQHAFQSDALIARIATAAVQSCASFNPPLDACLPIDETNLRRCMLAPDRTACVPHYWIRSYDPIDPYVRNCTGPVGDSSLTLAQYLDAALPGTGSYLQAWLARRNAASAVAVTEPPPPVEAASTPVTGLANAPSSASLPCAGVTALIKIFGPADRDSAAALRPGWRALGANVPPIEDVWDTARRERKTAPTAPLRTAVFYPDDSRRQCALRLGEAPDAAVGRMSWAFASSSVIEIWIAPVQPPSTSAASVDTQSLAGLAIDLQYEESVLDLALEARRRLLAAGVAGSIRLKVADEAFFKKYGAAGLNTPEIRYEQDTEADAANALMAILRQPQPEIAAKFDKPFSELHTHQVENRTPGVVSVFLRKDRRAAAAPATAQMSPLMTGTGYDGNDLDPTRWLALGSPQECAAACAANSACKAMTFVRSNKSCWLKSSSERKREVADEVSAVKVPQPVAPQMSALTYGTGYDHNDLSANGWLSAGSPQDCSDACAANSACKAMTFVQSNKSCWLKSAAENKVDVVDEVSAIKLAQPGAGQKR